MTRQFCREKWGKNDHVFGKICHCVMVVATSFCGKIQLILVKAKIAQYL